MEDSGRVRRGDLGVLQFLRIALAVFLVVAPCLGLLWYGVTHEIRLMRAESAEKNAETYVTKEEFYRVWTQLQQNQKEMTEILHDISQHVTTAEQMRSEGKR